jgi:acid phosphatase type 7
MKQSWNDRRPVIMSARATHSGAHVGVWVAFGLGLTACMTNQSGNIGASKEGDTSMPARRGSSIAPLTQACGGRGELTATGSALVERQPYLQQVTSSSVMIGWVSSGSQGQRIELSSPDSSLARSASSEREATTVRNAGEQQMWAHIDGLTPATIYCYALFDDSGALSGRIGFRTAPAADDPAPIGFLAFGDSGGGGVDQRSLVDQMDGFPEQLIIHTGDLAYDHGTINDIEDTVFGFYAGLFRHLPFFPASGNHDYETSQGAPFRAVFALPGDERWYSYDWGRIHFVALDTEASYSTQAAWLDADLAASALLWKVVYFHRPPYSSGEHGSDTSLRQALEPILEKHHVQLVLAGHDHNYERMTPQRGIQYVVTGGGGVGTRPVGSSTFTAFSEAVIHFVYVESTVDEMVLHAIDGTGAEFDAVMIPR